MDQQWILDKLLQLGNFVASQDTQIKQQDRDIARLTGLFDRVTRLETSQTFEDEHERSNPMHRQVYISAIATIAAVAAVVVSVWSALAQHH